MINTVSHLLFGGMAPGDLLLIGFAAGLTAALGVVAVAIVMARQNGEVACWTGCVGRLQWGLGAVAVLH